MHIWREIIHYRVGYPDVFCEMTLFCNANNSNWGSLSQPLVCFCFDILDQLICLCIYKFGQLIQTELVIL